MFDLFVIVNIDLIRNETRKLVRNISKSYLIKIYSTKSNFTCFKKSITVKLSYAFSIQVSLICILV